MKSFLYNIIQSHLRTSLLFLVFMFSTFHLISQEKVRVEVTGKIVVDSDDIEGITVFNTSSNKGTITDENGAFAIEVGLNDRVEFGALQFEDFTVVIDENIMNSRKMTVFLVEQINKLDEVIILPYGLSGNLTIDIESVKTFNPNMNALYFGVKHSSDYEFPDDIRSKVVNSAMHSQSYTMTNGLNVVNLVGLFVKPLLKSKKQRKGETIESSDDFVTNTIKMNYSERFINENFGIAQGDIDAFILYMEAGGLDESLLNSGSELELLEFISQKSKEFLKQKRD